MSGPSSNLARQACVSCRRQKRKCSREWPTCDLCRKNRRPCSYPPEALEGLSFTQQPTPSEHPSAYSSPQEPQPLPGLLEPQQASDTNTKLFFLDSYIFQISHAVVQQPSVRLPPDFVLLLGDQDQLRRDVDAYFTRFHPTFPIVSKFRLRRELAQFPDVKPDTVFLFMVIRLVCRSMQADREAVSQLYSSCKMCAALFDAAGAISLRHLQALLLLAHHEISYVLYPSAYMMVGTCSRVGAMMGLHSGHQAQRMLNRTTSIVEHEELQRCFWGTLTLDRYVNIGLDERPLCCRNANPEDHLPMDESCWETGETSVRPTLAVSAEAIVAAPPFARTCQATHMLTRVLTHVNDRAPATPEDFDAYYTEAMQLHRILAAFGTALWQEMRDVASACLLDRPDLSNGTPGAVAGVLALTPAMAICFSSQLSLYDVHLCADSEHPRAAGLSIQLEMQQVALESSRPLAAAVETFAHVVSSAVRRSQNEQAGRVKSEDLTPIVSPLVTNCLFQQAKTLSWYYRETGNKEVSSKLDTIVGALKDLAAYWPVATEYLRILQLDCICPFP